MFASISVNEASIFHCFSGKIVEYDEPMQLMKKEGSLFGQLVKEYWSHLQSAESHIE